MFRHWWTSLEKLYWALWSCSEQEGSIGHTKCIQLPQSQLAAQLSVRAQHLFTPLTLPLLTWFFAPSGGWSCTLVEADSVVSFLVRSLTEDSVAA